MINLKPDTEDSFSEYKNAVERKDNSPDKRELKSIEKEMEDCYTKYKNRFVENNLEHIVPAPIGQLHKGVLLDLYNPKASIIKHFRQRFFSQNPQTYNNRCPYCTLSEANTTEHILHKDKYPEFAVDTLNLIPACSVCNSLKGEQVVDSKDKKKLTINFYTDNLPNEQYLFVDFEVSGINIKPTYRLENLDNKVDTDKFLLIERHFEKYNLLNRFNIKAIQEITEIKNLYLVESFANETEYNIFAAKQIRKVNMDRLLLGYNHWKVILYISAASSDIFKNYILSKPK